VCRLKFTATFFNSVGYRFPLRVEVERSNASRLNAIKTDPITYTAEDFPTGTDPESQRARKLLENLMAPETLTLKVGAQVMLIRNAEEFLVNGSVGTVEAFEPSMEAYAAKFEQSAKGKSTAQFEMPEEKPDVKRSGGLGEPLYPVVKWKLPGGGSFTSLVERHEFKIEEREKVLASRKQVTFANSLSDGPNMGN
jgi:ATP-dependent DNA helicase PIF1